MHERILAGFRVESTALLATRNKSVLEVVLWLVRVSLLLTESCLTLRHLKLLLRSISIRERLYLRPSSSYDLTLFYLE